MKKGLFLITIFFVVIQSQKLYSQEGEELQPSKERDILLSLYTGPRFGFVKNELFKPDINFGAELKYLITKKWYALFNYSYQTNNILGRSDYLVRYPENPEYVSPTRYTYSRTEHLFFLGAGYYIFEKQKHKVYAEAMIGVGKYNVVHDSPRKITEPYVTYTHDTHSGGKVDPALAISAGYDYFIVDKFAVGVRYMGYYIITDGVYRIDYNLDESLFPSWKREFVYSNLICLQLTFAF